MTHKASDTLQNSAEHTVSFKDTLNLPRTDFPIRSNPKEDDPAMIKRWEDEDLYTQTFESNKHNRTFILHDGPPYANGHTHIGHAYNKILKDIITKSQRMFGAHVPVTPGWDCHGLPIELAVSKEHPQALPQELKRACRTYANKWIDIQKEEFKRLGVLMDWKNPYLTMSYEYEAAILRSFGEFVERGYIERSNKTVPWCGSCQTVLATAEIEYQDRKDPSIYVKFPLDPARVRALIPELEGQEVSIVIWTTTPWTLPLNRAVLLKPETEYAVVELTNTPDNALDSTSRVSYIIIAQALVEKLSGLTQSSKKIIKVLKSENFKGERVQHPLIKNFTVPVLLVDWVSLEDGTGAVHCAPGCGPDDYTVGVRHSLDIFSPISPAGTYTSGIMPQELENMPVTDGQIWVLRALAANNNVLYKHSINHSYPHCWRCHNGLIFRATPQWFCDLSKNDLKERSLKAIEGITALPEASKNRLKATISGRLEWCLSRQRVWGVPIPALICLDCDTAYITSDLVTYVANQVKNSGVEFWDTIDIHSLIPKDHVCLNCSGNNFKKETDILDVWFDSGVSHYAVLRERPELSFPADVYVEGKDQHRGWFQSSLLTSMVLNNQSPYTTLITHGFTVDKNGRKMSKSLGNVVSPTEMIEKLGTDGLRLWTSSIECGGDAIISDVLIRNVQEVLRKVRNTCRFLVSNLYDYNHEKDAVSLDQLQPIDRYALEQLYQINREILYSYAQYDVTAVFHGLGDYCSAQLSSFYLDIVKDRLYIEQSDGHLRRSAQTVCWYILDTLTRNMAPILSFTAEQLSDVYQQDKKQSIHLQEFNYLKSVFDILAGEQEAFVGSDFLTNTPALIEFKKHEKVAAWHTQWNILKDVRSAILKAIELERQKGLIKHSLEARVTIFIDKMGPAYEQLMELFERLANNGQSMQSSTGKSIGQSIEQPIENLIEHSIEHFMKEFVIVSQFILSETQGGCQLSEFNGVYVSIEHAYGDKCPRCWNWDVTTHEHKLCNRCQPICKKMK